MVFVNDYLENGSDSDAIENAMREKGNDGTVVFSKREKKGDLRDYWLLDRAILIPENTTVILRNCKVKLSDSCRDNFFRSANCGIGIENPSLISNVHILGEGRSVLEGADFPRATGDSEKTLAKPCPFLPEDILRLADWVSEEERKNGQLKFITRHDHSYGTDADNPNEKQTGDWRNIGILLANVEDFSIENISIEYSHGWGISLESCANGRVDKINFQATMYKEICGMMQNIENQDGIDLRNGCHHIVISDITGVTGDDVIALTAIANDEPVRKGGTLESTHVMGTDWTKRDKNIHDIIIRNVMAHSSLCWILRLLPGNTRIWNVIVDGIVDTTTQLRDIGGTILLGNSDGPWGINYPDSIRNVSISNVVAYGKYAVEVQGYLKDSVISNVISNYPGRPVVAEYRKNGLDNVQINGVVSISKNQE